MPPRKSRSILFWTLLITLLFFHELQIKHPFGDLQRSIVLSGSRRCSSWAFPDCAGFASTPSDGYPEEARSSQSQKCSAPFDYALRGILLQHGYWIDRRKKKHWEEDIDKRRRTRPTRASLRATRAGAELREEGKCRKNDIIEFNFDEIGNRLFVAANFVFLAAEQSGSVRA